MAVSLETIQTQFEGSLFFPKADPQKQCLVCPVGLVGAGKTTIVTPLAKSLNLVQVSADDLRRRLKESGNGYERLKELMFPVMTRLVHAGKSMVLDMDCANPVTVEWIHKSEKLYGLKVFWVHINPPESFIVKKLKTFKHTWLFKNGQEAVENYFSQKARRVEENLTFPFICSFDTSRADIQLQLQACIEQIQKELTHE